MRAIDCAKNGLSYKEYLSASTEPLKKHETCYNNLLSRFISMKQNTIRAVNEKAAIKQERIDLHRKDMKQKEELVRKEKERKHIENELLLQKIRTLIPSVDRRDYVIVENDYKRGNRVDNAYKKLYTLTVLEAFECQCANCFDMHNGYELDHFLFSKNEGGNFVMRNNDGFLVNNAVILCITCNRAKQDKNFTEFFTNEAISRILDVNKKISEIIHRERRIHEYCMI